MATLTGLQASAAWRSAGGGSMALRPGFTTGLPFRFCKNANEQNVMETVGHVRCRGKSSRELKSPVPGQQSVSSPGQSLSSAQLVSRSAANSPEARRGRQSRPGRRELTVPRYEIGLRYARRFPLYADALTLAFSPPCWADSGVIAWVRLFCCAGVGSRARGSRHAWLDARCCGRVAS